MRFQASRGQVGASFIASVAAAFAAGTGALWFAAGSPAGPQGGGSVFPPDLRDGRGPAFDATRLENREATAPGDAIGGGAAPVATGERLGAARGRGPAGFMSTADVLQDLGREVDLIRKELAVSEFEHLGALAVGLRPAAGKTLPPLTCLAADIREDLAAARRLDPREVSTAPLFDKMLEALTGPEGIMPRLKLAEAELEAGECLLEAARNNLAGPPQKTVGCHRRLTTAFAALEGSVRELAGIPGLVETEWGRIAPRLQAIASDRYHPERDRAAALLGFLSPRIRRYRDHTVEARWVLAAAEGPGDERAPDFAKGSRLRRDELYKTMDGFYPAWREVKPVSEAFQRVRDAALALDLAAQSWDRGGSAGRVHEVDGSRYTFEAFSDLMDAIRLLHAADGART